MRTGDVRFFRFEIRAGGFKVYDKIRTGGIIFFPFWKKNGNFFGVRKLGVRVNIFFSVFWVYRREV
jgi:hypothetical protein